MNKKNEESAKRVSDLRTKLGMTQVQFAHALGTQVAAVSGWENGHHAPSRLYYQEFDRLESEADNG